MSKLVVGVSGGPDSMMLLDKLIKENKEVVVAHVNYQMRPTAFRDEKIVEDYCLDNKLVFERYYSFYRTGNFQNWAREVRYRFFASVLKKYDCEKVAVAHHQNDEIETYLLQKQRKALVDYYGLAKTTVIAGVTIERPLLKYTKDEILHYCQKNNIKYGIDESNDKETYSRNIIRKKVEKLNKKELLNYKNKIEKDNRELQLFVSQIDDKRNFVKQDIKTQLHLVYQVLKNKGYYRFSTKHLEKINEQLLTKQYYKYRDKFIVTIKNNQISLAELKDCIYSYSFTELIYESYQHFALSQNGERSNGIEFLSSDFPITIRNWQKGDSIKKDYGTKKVNRWFIDNKISVVDRLSWPIVVNKDNEIILVPGLGIDITHNTDNANAYVIKL